MTTDYINKTMHAEENTNALRNICRLFALNGSEWEYAVWERVCMYTPNRTLRRVVTVARADIDVRPDLLGLLSHGKEHVAAKFPSQFANSRDHAKFYADHKQHIAIHISNQLSQP